jgi:hypothetical protein
MYWSPAVHRCIAKIALVFVVVGTLVPSFSHAVMAGGWQRICASGGETWVLLVAPGEGDKSSTPQAGGHCLFCSSRAAAPGLLPSVAPVLHGVLQGPVLMPSVALAAPQEPQHWVSATPRGPPRLS